MIGNKFESQKHAEIFLRLGGKEIRMPKHAECGLWICFCYLFFGYSI